jgi:hypothetical protein
VRLALRAQIKKALQQCALQLSKKLAKRQARPTRKRVSCCCPGKC